jgi:hypothetical protein
MARLYYTITLFVLLYLYLYSSIQSHVSMGYVNLNVQYNIAKIGCNIKINIIQHSIV